MEFWDHYPQPPEGGKPCWALIIVMLLSANICCPVLRWSVFHVCECVCLVGGVEVGGEEVEEEEETKEEVKMKGRCIKWEGDKDEKSGKKGMKENYKERKEGGDVQLETNKARRKRFARVCAPQKTK